MADNVIIRCGKDQVSVVTVDRAGIIVNARSYEIYADKSENWFGAFSETIAKIPKKLRKKINFVIPPNSEIHIKHLQIPDVTKKGMNDAFNFECEQGFPGGSSEWSWHIYRINSNQTHAFGIAMRKEFADQMIDVLIRNKIHFSFMCPEILLNTVAVKHNVANFQNSLLANIEKEAAHLSCLGDNAEYLRTLPITGESLTTTMAESQKISPQRAEELQSELLLNTADENRAFVIYYAKQFAQKLRQEFKRSELFYCRNFKQPPISTVYLAGNKARIYKYFKFEENTQMVDIFEVLKNKLSPKLSSEEVDIVKDTIGAFVGAATCLKTKQRNLLNLFASDFWGQVDFQKQHLGYLLIAVVITLLGLTTLKIFIKDVANLNAKRAALEAKVTETKIDVIRYNELEQERSVLRNFIANAKLAFDSQYAWGTFFEDLQAQISTLQTAWISSLDWENKSDTPAPEIINVTIKMLMIDNELKKSAVTKIESFASALSKFTWLKQLRNLKISQQNENILTFSFAIELHKQSPIFGQ